MADISDGRGNRRLNSWKEIAAFFGKDERTVKRWESARGLPVRRIPGGNRTTVFAYSEELEAWMHGSAQTQIAGRDMSPERSANPLLWIVPMALAIGVAGGVFYALAVLPQGERTAAVARYVPPAAAEELYLSAVFDLNTRTGEGIRRSMETFGKAISLAPLYAEAHAGLATAYNLVSQYTLAPAAESYAMGRREAELAISLDPNLAEAHAALGFNLFNGSHDFAGSAAAFETALKLDPNSAQAMHWYALTSMQLGQFERPLALMARAQQLKPESLPIRANRALIMFHARQVEPALAILEGMRQDFPDYLATPSYLATIYLDQLRYGEFLNAYAEAARIERNAARTKIAEAARQGFEQGGGAGLLRAMYEAQLQAHAAGKEPAYKVAATAALLGKSREAIDWLIQSRADAEPAIWGTRVDPAFRSLHGNPEFTALLTELGFPAP